MERWDSLHLNLKRSLKFGALGLTGLEKGARREARSLQFKSIKKLAHEIVAKYFQGRLIIFKEWHLILKEE